MACKHGNGSPPSIAIPKSDGIPGLVQNRTGRILKTQPLERSEPLPSFATEVEKHATARRWKNLAPGSPGCWQPALVGIPQLRDVESVGFMVCQAFVGWKAVAGHRDALVSAKLLNRSKVNRKKIPVYLDSQPCGNSTVLGGEPLNQPLILGPLVKLVAGVQVAGSRLVFVSGLDADEVSHALLRSQNIGERMVTPVMVQVPDGFKSSPLQVVRRDRFAKVTKFFCPLSGFPIQDGYSFHCQEQFFQGLHANGVTVHVARSMHAILLRRLGQMAQGADAAWHGMLRHKGRTGRSQCNRQQGCP